MVFKWNSFMSMVSPWLCHSSARATASDLEGMKRSSLYIVFIILLSKEMDQKVPFLSSDYMATFETLLKVGAVPTGR